MENYQYQIIESSVSILLFFVTKIVLKHSVKLTVLNSYFKLSEKKYILKLLNLLLIITLSIILVAIWSVKQENVLLFVSSLLTVFGVALFAEMSILSNITACIILFFQHPIKIGDIISVQFEGKEIEGELMDITYFFIFVRTHNNETFTIPNALFIKSSFSVKSKE